MSNWLQQLQSMLGQATQSGQNHSVQNQSSQGSQGLSKLLVPGALGDALKIPQDVREGIEQDIQQQKFNLPG